MHAEHGDAAVNCQDSRESGDNRSDGGPASRIRTMRDTRDILIYTMMMMMMIMIEIIIYRHMHIIKYIAHRTLNSCTGTATILPICLSSDADTALVAYRWFALCLMTNPPFIFGAIVLPTIIIDIQISIYIPLLCVRLHPYINTYIYAYI